MPGQELVPRATIEEVVARADKAKALFAEAFDAIKGAADKIADATKMATLPGREARYFGAAERCDEVSSFEEAVKLPNRNTYLRAACKLTDMHAWSWIVEKTELERLMDAEAKQKLHQQMRYIPEQSSRRGQLITGDEVERGMPPLTVDNVYATIEQFALDADSIFRRGIANAFSKLDRRFKSHDGFKIGSRVILTYAFSSYSGGLQYGPMRDTLLDIERAFAVIEKGGHLGARYGEATEQVSEDRRGFYEPHQSETITRYFRIKGWKNGNAHLHFTRDDLVRKVNKLLAEWYGEVIGDAHNEGDIFNSRKTTPARRFGFFPSPEGVVESVLEKVELYRESDEEPLTILEPSAGTGNLSRPLANATRAAVRGWGREPDQPERAYGHKVDVVEIQPEMARQLRAERIYRKVHCANFLEMEPDSTALYDRVVMNPPFDLERDIDHVTHAMRFLKPEGQLVAIMSAGTEFRETKKAIAFRKLVESKKGHFYELPACSFSSVGTNVNTVMLNLWSNGRSGRH